MISSLISVLSCMVFALYAATGRKVWLAFFNVATCMIITTIHMINPALFGSNEYTGFAMAIINAMYLFTLGYVLVVTRTNQNS